MNDFDTDIDEVVVSFFYEHIICLSEFKEMNELIKQRSGINNFFHSQKDADELKERVEFSTSFVSEPNRKEYGDFQTNERLAKRALEYICLKRNDFEFVLEPTCGQGNFILAALQHLKKLKKIVGVEIYQPYIWTTKLKILSYFLKNKDLFKPEIDIIHDNVFSYDYGKLADLTNRFKSLIVGNPPWVTNAGLSKIDSKNLPRKSNFKKQKGFDAITGKGNFDIGEYISMIMLRCFDNHDGMFAFLIKNAVVKNIIHEQKKNPYRIAKSEILNIDAKKEFNVSVKSGLFLTHLNKKPDFVCEESDLYSREKGTSFGWYQNKFVYSIEGYTRTGFIDGKSVFTWRSGIKHDCSKIMELEEKNGFYFNGLGEKISLEEGLLYGLLKSSDLKLSERNEFRKLTIVTQKKIGQDTQYIEDDFPLTYQYLNEHRPFFDKRKSSIYRDKPDFSIFGVGDYSFTDYKVAISGLYKSTHFTLISPNPYFPKPIMLDDTCYFIGFKEFEMAKIAHYIVNSDVGSTVS